MVTSSIAWGSARRKHSNLVSPEFQTELFVVDAKMAVAAARYCLGHQRQHFLRDHPDIGLAAAEIAEAIIAKAIAEMAELHDVVLQRNIGTPTTTASATESASTATETASGLDAATASEPSRATACKAAAAIANAHLATCRGQIGGAA